MHVGQTVKFPCETKLREDVNWKRMDIVDYIYLWGNMEPAHDPRITVDKNSSYTLTILNVTAEDSVSYRCAEDDGLGSKRYYGLTVTGYICVYTSSFDTVYFFDEVLYISLGELVCCLVCLFIDSFIDSFIHSFIDSLIHSFIDSFIH